MRRSVVDVREPVVVVPLAEGNDIFLSLFNGLLLGDLLSHDAKIPGNKLVWKDIDFMPDVEGESKKKERNGENVVRKM